MSGDGRPAITLQQLAGAAERLRDRERGPSTDWLGLVEEAMERLARHPFEALSLSAFVRHEGGKERVVASPAPVERLIEEALLPVLHRALDHLLLPSVHAYRSGRSTWTAAAAVSAGLAAGFTYLATLDIASYFDSIDRLRLHEELVPYLHPAEVEIVDALVAAPLLREGLVVERERGIPQGRAVSPLLANVYLVPLDKSLDGADGVYVRYGDDLFLATRSAMERDRLEERLRDALSELGLCLRAEKSCRFTYSGAPFVYLGHAVDAKGVYEKVGESRLERILNRPAHAAGCDASPSITLEHPNRRARTLYITDPGLYLSVRKGLVVVQRGRQVVRELPLHRIDRVLILAGASMSSGFIAACVADRVPVLFFVGKGKAFGSLVAGGMPNPLRLRAQYDLLGQPHRKTSLARAVVRAKIEAMRLRLRGEAELRARLSEMLERLETATDGAGVRGYEGVATRIYYEGFALRIHEPAFAFRGRSKRPPRDPLNSLLSFSYSLLFGEMQTALLADGLDPYPGLLHDLKPEHPALASDLVEPYRVALADSFVLHAVNTGQVAAEDFETLHDGAVYLKPEARRVVLDAYETFMERGPRGASPRRLVHAAARAMLRVVLGETAELVLPLVASAVEDPGPEVIVA